MRNNALTILGSSSGLPQAERACSGYLLQTGESLSLIDCGGGVCGSFLKHGFDPLKLDRVFISHTHSDHVGELPLLIQMLHVLNAHRTLDVYIPHEFVTPFNNYLNAVYLIRENLKVHVQVHGYSPGTVIDAPFRVEAIPNSHLESSRPLVEKLGLPNRMQCHSFRVQLDNKTIFYSADIGSLDDIVTHLHDLNLAIVETTHADLTPLTEIAGSSSIDRLVLTHLGGPDDLARLNELIAASGLTNVLLAADGLELEL